ncbi:MAG TPA: hypothetical protein VEK38_02375 [Candidatus Bathyarchaeia archaeon]|nr:hypothetical protein [Candidatus Bathyarchaeia archaeon]
MWNKKGVFVSTAHHRWYMCFLSVRPLYRYAFTACIIIALVCIWQNTVHQFFALSLHTHLQEQKALVAHCCSLSSAIKDVNELNELNATLHAQCSAYENDCQQFMESSGTCLLSLATQKGLHIEEYSIDDSTTKNAPHKSYMQYRFRGTYENLIAFFDSLIDTYSFLFIKTNTIERCADNLFSFSLLFTSFTFNPSLRL